MAKLLAHATCEYDFASDERGGAWLHVSVKFDNGQAFVTRSEFLDGSGTTQLTETERGYVALYISRYAKQQEILHTSTRL